MDSSQLLYQQGLAFHRQGMLDKAQNAYQQTVQINPYHAPAWHTLGVMASQSGNPEKGFSLILKALAIAPSDPVFLTNASTALLTLQRFDEAMELSGQAIEANPSHFPAHRNLAAALIGLKRYTEAIISLDHALALKPETQELYISRSNALCALKNFTEAIATADKLLVINPSSFEAHYAKANAYKLARAYKDAIASYRKALSLQPGHVLAWFNLGDAYQFDKNYVQAVESYSKALNLNKDISFGWGTLLHAKMLYCDWHDFDHLLSKVMALNDAGRQTSIPFGYQALCDDEASLKICAETATQALSPPSKTPYEHPSWAPHQKIRVGYLCGEFREQATSILMTEVWELHDKSKFEIIAFDNGWNDHSPRRKRIQQAFDHLYDISALSDPDAAQLIFDCQIDVLINLNGYFGLGRNQVFAYKPSPVQVNFLGFPATLGAPYMDYLIADEQVIPRSSQIHYTEKIAYVAGCYQPNDAQRQISHRQFTRSELCLPEHGFVYCCFNNSYKITPHTFDVWMRILKQVPDSVLWLLSDTPEATANLQNEARLRGIDPDRLVFADRMPNEDHLARHAMADLFLDTWPYNAHTTASDALWAGLPLLTLQGRSFPGRVAGSLLKAVQCEDMVCDSIAAYESKAISLATKTHLLLQAKEALSRGKLQGTLYNTPFFTREFEKVLMQMVQL